DPGSEYLVDLPVLDPLAGLHVRGLGEQRDDHRHAVHPGFQAHARRLPEASVPVPAHLRPVAGGGVPVVAGRAEVHVLRADVIVETELARDLVLRAAGLAPHLGIELLVGPAAGRERVPVDHRQRVVVAAPGVLATRQRAPARVAGPARHIVVVAPAAGAAVTRRIADFVDALGPGATGDGRRDRAHAPGLVGAEFEAGRRLVAPVLPPVL